MLCYITTLIFTAIQKEILNVLPLITANKLKYIDDR